MMLESGPLREPETIGRYRVLRTLDDSGRHGVVLAEAPNSRRRVVVRFAREDGEREAVLDGFLREREAAEALDVGVVDVIEVGEDPVMGPFLAMEFVDGLSLRESLRRGALELDTALALLVDVGNALDAAHARGVVHGDLRPSRILVDPTGTAVVTGFAARDGDSVIAVGADWPYLAPERVAGAPPSPEADRWGLAAVAFELLTGQPPAEEPGLAALAEPGLRGVFQRALAREPHSRHPSVRSFLEDLLAASAIGETEKAALVASLPPAWRPEPKPVEIERRQRRVVGLAVFGIVSALLLRAGGDWMLEQVPTPPKLRVLEVSSAPKGATVLVDGVPVGETPRRLYAASDARRVFVYKEGYLPADRVLDRSDRVIDLALERAAPLRVASVAPRPRRPQASADRAALASAPSARPEPAEPEAKGLLPLLAEWLRDERR